jgi:Lrp/AsnC family transcriptional regulator, cysteine-sensing transcriptional activator
MHRLTSKKILFCGQFDKLSGNPLPTFSSAQKRIPIITWVPAGNSCRQLSDFLLMIDRIDRRILSILQEDCTIPVAEIGRRVGLSTTPCWRRIQKMEEDGVITGRVALLNPTKVNAKVTAFVAITTSQHSEDWLKKFADVIQEFPEVVEFYRMAGQVDYLLRVAVPDIEAYDAFYKKLIAKIDISDVSTTFAMEQIKNTTALPLSYVPPEKPRAS